MTKQTTWVQCFYIVTGKDELSLPISISCVGLFVCCPIMFRKARTKIHDMLTPSPYNFTYDETYCILSKYLLDISQFFLIAMAVLLVFNGLTFFKLGEDNVIEKSSTRYLIGELIGVLRWRSQELMLILQMMEWKS